MRERIEFNDMQQGFINIQEAINWDFPTLPSMGFIVQPSCSSLGENASLVPEVKGERPDCFELTQISPIFL